MPINQNQLEPFKNLELVAKKVVEGFITGMHKSPFHGFSVEFAEHRLYNKGESTKHMDWKLYARTDKLFIKRYEEETNLRCQIVIDQSSSMLFPKDAENTKLKFSVYAAAALCELLKQQRDAFGLTVFQEKIKHHLPAKGSTTQKKIIFDQLEKMMEESELNHSTSAASALNEIAEIVHKRSLVVIFSDMFDNKNIHDDLFSALQHLKFRKHEVILFHVTDKKLELDFEFENRPYHFIDMESGEELKLNPNQVKEQYLQSINKYKEELELKCGQYQIDFIEADINEGFDKILYAYLVKRNLMSR
ncbi:MAG: DUF58 domain-containing protein [Sphingobacteriaceae bacterium]|jgi:uncharacterized protein (DUF58 family)